MVSDQTLVRYLASAIDPASRTPRYEQLGQALRSLLAQGRLPGTLVLGYRLTVEPDAARILTGQPEGLVFELSRLRLVDGTPFVVELAYLPVSCGERLPPDRLTQVPLYELLAEVCGITVTHADEHLRPVVLAQPEAALLGLHVGEPAFLVERTAYAGEHAVEVRRSIIRGDRYRFRVQLAGPHFATTPE